MLLDEMLKKKDSKEKDSDNQENKLPEDDKSSKEQDSSKSKKTMKDLLLGKKQDSKEKDSDDVESNDDQEDESGSNDTSEDDIKNEQILQSIFEKLGDLTDGLREDLTKVEQRLDVLEQNSSKNEGYDELKAEVDKIKTNLKQFSEIYELISDQYNPFKDEDSHSKKIPASIKQSKPISSNESEEIEQQEESQQPIQQESNQEPQQSSSAPVSKIQQPMQQQALKQNSEQQQSESQQPTSQELQEQPMQKQPIQEQPAQQESQQLPKQQPAEANEPSLRPEQQDLFQQPIKQSEKQPESQPLPEPSEEQISENSPAETAKPELEQQQSSEIASKKQILSDEQLMIEKQGEELIWNQEPKDLEYGIDYADEEEYSEEAWKEVLEKELEVEADENLDYDILKDRMHLADERKEHLKYLSRNLSGNQRFFSPGFEPFSNILELVNALNSSQELFDRHVGQGYDHFADWIENSFMLHNLADALRKIKNKEDYIIAILSDI